jgi:hypothetical protein
MRVVGYGESRPAVRPPTREADVPKNRRIEITILEPGADDNMPGVGPRTRSPQVSSAAASVDPAVEVDRALDAEFEELTIADQLALTSRALE